MQFKDKFYNRLNRPQQSVSSTPIANTATPQRVETVRTVTEVKTTSNPLTILLLTISIGINVLLLPFSYITWQFMGSPEYAVWVARNRTHVVLDDNMIRRHEQYYRNVEELLRNQRK